MPPTNFIAQIKNECEICIIQITFVYRWITCFYKHTVHKYILVCMYVFTDMCLRVCVFTCITYIYMRVRYIYIYLNTIHMPHDNIQCITYLYAYISTYIYTYIMQYYIIIYWSIFTNYIYRCF